jgi:uncharacterized membrane-anchored protein
MTLTGKHRRVLVVLGLVAVLGGVNWSIYSKERIKSSGELVYLELAPRDPRSLMQGDYMALRFAIEAALATGPDAGRQALVVDARRVARAAAAGEAGQLELRYRVRQGRPWIGTNAYFFEEGTAGRYERARYGKFRLDRHSGEAVLVGLAGEDLADL